MATINGVGGVFLFSEDPKRLADWYQDAFDLPLETYGETAFGYTFAAVDPKDSSRRFETVFSIMKAKSNLPKMPANSGAEDMYGDQPYMVNLRVDDLEATLTRLAERGVKPLFRQDESYGKFAWVRDADGHRVELWEPIGAFTSDDKT